MWRNRFPAVTRPATCADCCINTTKVIVTSAIKVEVEFKSNWHRHDTTCVSMAHIKKMHNVRLRCPWVWVCVLCVSRCDPRMDWQPVPSEHHLSPKGHLGYKALHLHCEFAAYLKTTFPALSAFHALIRAKSPLMAFSIM